jgi:hypothetical protein
MPQALEDIKVMSKLCHDLNFDQIIESVDQGCNDFKATIKHVQRELSKADDCKDGSTKILVLTYYAGHGSIN